MSALKTILLSIAFLAALYFGSGGFIYLQNEQNYEAACALPEKSVSSGKIKFHNKEMMVCCEEQELIVAVYPFVHKIPAALRYIITALSFGLIGALARLINNIVTTGNSKTIMRNVLLIPLQGAIIGLIVLGISYTIPIFLSNESSSLKPITVVFLSLFAGVSYLEFYPWFTDAVRKKLQTESTESNGGSTTATN